MVTCVYNRMRSECNIPFAPRNNFMIRDAFRRGDVHESSTCLDYQSFKLQKIAQVLIFIELIEIVTSKKKIFSPFRLYLCVFTYFLCICRKLAKVASNKLANESVCWWWSQGFCINTGRYCTSARSQGFSLSMRGWAANHMRAVWACTHGNCKALLSTCEGEGPTTC
jgi:hypothetical protein